MERLDFFLNQFVPTNIQAELKLRTYIPDYIPSIGEMMDIKVEPPQKITRKEPTTRPINETVLKFQLKNKLKKNLVESHYATNQRELAQYVEDSKHLLSNSAVVFSQSVPQEEDLMEVWSTSINDILCHGKVGLEHDLDTQQFTELSLSLIGIPFDASIRSKIEGLYILFNVYNEFKNSGHFKF
eukprot:NODE_17_length_48642_cov_1.199349.p33 type:complete len:184 gc:universal NODE_17_length_48642_cov_1.199349:753-202(-)